MTYTPTTEEMREWYVRRDRTGRSSRKEYELEFDAWLAQHDREVRAQALEDVADAIDADPAFRDPLRLRADWLRARAEKERG